MVIVSVLCAVALNMWSSREKKAKKVKKPNDFDIITKKVGEFIYNRIGSEKLSNYVDKLIAQISIGYSISTINAKEWLIKKLGASVVFGGVVFVACLIVFKALHISLLLGSVVGYMYMNITVTKIQDKLEIIEASFPEIIQHFADEYAVTKNVKTALVAIVRKTHSGVAKTTFESLVKEVHTKGKWEVEVDKMAKALDFFYAYAFAEILKLSLTDVGDISRDLDNLINTMQEDIEQRQQTKSTMHENKMMFYLLNTVALVALVGNAVLHPFARDVYAYTTTGSALVFAWVLQLVLGYTYLRFMDNV